MGLGNGEYAVQPPSFLMCFFIDFFEKPPTQILPFQTLVSHSGSGQNLADTPLWVSPLVRPCTCIPHSIRSLFGREADFVTQTVVVILLFKSNRYIFYVQGHPFSYQNGFNNNLFSYLYLEYRKIYY